LFVTSSCRPALGSRLRSNRNGTADTRRAGLIRLHSRLLSSFGGLRVHALSTFHRTGVDGLAAVRGPPCAQRSSGEPYELTMGIPALSSRKVHSAAALLLLLWACLSLPGPEWPRRLRTSSSGHAAGVAWRRASGALPQTGGDASSTDAHRIGGVTQLSSRAGLTG
jgi:hypothetical protein